MKKIFLIIPFLIICFITIGFSALEQNLFVDNIGVVVRAYKQVRITNISNPVLSNNASNASYDYNVKDIVGRISLPNSSSSVTYDVIVTNIGNVDVGILNTVVTANGNSNILEATINSNDYTLGTKICNSNNVCNGGISKTIRVTIKYKSGASVINGDIDFVATLNFQNYYTITYSGFDNTTGLLTGILEGDTTTITFNNTTGMPSDVTVVGATGAYTYQATTNPDTSTLTLSNITGNITITALAGSVEVIDNGDGTTTTVIENTVTNGDGTETTTTTMVNQDANGNTTSSSQTTTTTGTSGGVTTTETTVVNYDANGDQTSATETTTTESSSGSTVTTINYDADNNPTTGSTANIDSSGNVNTQETTYNVDGDPVVTGYNIDTSGNSNGGETISNGLETGVLVFDGHDWTATLKATILFSDITPVSTQFPILNVSARDGNNKLNGAFFLVTRQGSGMGSAVYDENGTQQSTTTSNNPTLKWRIQAYSDGSLTKGIDFYYKNGTTAYYTNRFGSKTSTLTLVYKMSFNATAKTLTTEIYQSDGTTILAKPRSQATLSFPDQMDGIDFEIGKAVNVSGTQLKTKMEIISFEVVKSL